MFMRRQQPEAVKSSDLHTVYVAIYVHIQLMATINNIKQRTNICLNDVESLNIDVVSMHCIFGKQTKMINMNML